jgi:hypothetical protein
MMAMDALLGGIDTTGEFIFMLFMLYFLRLEKSRISL